MKSSTYVGVVLYRSTAASRQTGSRSKLIPFAAALAAAVLFSSAQTAQAEAPVAQGGVYATLLAQEAQARPAAPTGSRHHGAVYADPAISALADFVRSIGGTVAGKDTKQSESVWGPNRASAHASLRGEQVDVPNDSAHAALRGARKPMGAVEADPKDEAFAALLDYAERITGQEYQIAAAPGVAPARTKRLPAEGATYIGSQACMKCHAQSAEYYKTVMGRIARTQKGKLECESCHGPGSLHVAAGGGRGVGGMLDFKPTTAEKVEEINLICLGCHQKGGRTAWRGSTHETRGLACTNCHVVMRDITPKFQLIKQTEQETCYQCHKLQRAQMQRSSHMPIREGKMTCSNCHNPHGSVYGTEAMLREASINDNCYKCHADKRGPVLHEHMPVRENCLNCHDAHGSNHEYLLKIQRPRLCAECHGFAHGGQTGFNRNSVFAFGHACQNCHTNIHGSNHPSGAFFLR